MDVFFNKEYGAIYEPVENGECCEFLHQSSSGTVKNVFIKRRIRIGDEETGYYDIITPYGYGGPVALDVVDEEPLWTEYYSAFSEYCKNHNIVAEFVRFHLFDNEYGRTHYYGDVTYVLDNIVRYTDRPIEVIWREYESKVRKNVNRALSYGLSVFSEENDEHLDKFLDIYYKTMDRNNATAYYYFDRSFFMKLLSGLKGGSRFFYVTHEDQIISAELILIGDEYCYSFLGGTYEESYQMRPNDFLKHEIIKWCVDNNKKAFVLGGGYHKEDGIFRYKKAFAPDEDSMVPFFVGKKVHLESVYASLVRKHCEMFGPITDTGYFPEYRAK